MSDATVAVQLTAAEVSGVPATIEIDEQNPYTWKDFNTGSAKYAIGEVLGEGEFGKIFHCTKLPIGKQGEFSKTAPHEPECIAMKVTQRPVFNREMVDFNSLIDFGAEANRAFDCEAGNVLPVDISLVNSYGGMVTDTHNIFWMELMDGSLSDFVFTSWNEVRALFQGVLKALSVLSIYRQVHYDIKVDNIMFKRGARFLPGGMKTDEELTFALGDFGFLSATGDSDGYSENFSVYECIPEEKRLNATVLHKADVYFAGCMLEEVLENVELEGDEERKMFKNIVKAMTCEYWKRKRGDSLVRMLQGSSLKRAAPLAEDEEETAEEFENNRAKKMRV